MLTSHRRAPLAGAVDRTSAGPADASYLLGQGPAARGATGFPQRPWGGQAGRGEKRGLDPADLGPHQLTEKRQALVAQEQRSRILLVRACRMGVPLRAVPNAQAAIRQRPLGRMAPIRAT